MQAWSDGHVIHAADNIDNKTGVMSPSPTSQYKIVDIYIAMLVSESLRSLWALMLMSIIFVPWVKFEQDIERRNLFAIVRQFAFMLP